MKHFKSTKAMTVSTACIAALGVCAVLGLPSAPQKALARTTPVVLQDTRDQASSTITVTAYFPDGTNISVGGVPASTTCKSNVRLAMLNANYLNSKFTFQTSYYYPYGDYVTEINGWYGSGNKYWALYVNGSSASCGIDTQTLNPGDQVAWYLISSTDSEKHDEDSFQAKVFEVRKQRQAQ